MPLFGKLNNVMSAKRVVNKPLTEERMAVLEEAIIFGGKTKTILEEVNGVKPATQEDLLTESLISDPTQYKRMQTQLLAIKEYTNV